MRTPTRRIDLDRFTAIAAGVALGTIPMLWSSIVVIGSLDVRPAHAAGAITLALVLLPNTRAQIRTASLFVLGGIGGLTVLGATANSLVHADTFWPTSELVRLIANLLIALAVTSAIPFGDAPNLRGMGWATSAGLTWSLTVWLGSIASTSDGIDGALATVLRGRNHHLLYEIQLPAMRSLYHENVLLGTRHGVIFGFLVSAAMLHAFAGAVDDRWLRRVARLLATVSLLAIVLSSSRSAFAALAIAATAYLVSRRATVLRFSRSYAVAAGAVLLLGTSAAAGLLARFTNDTASFQSRQGDAAKVLDADWSLVGLPALSRDVNSPHNSFIEMAAGAGILGLLAAVAVAAIALAALWPRRSTGLTVYLLAAAVIVRAVTAARGSLDTAALIALTVVLIGLPAVTQARRGSLQTPPPVPTSRPVAAIAGGVR